MEEEWSEEQATSGESMRSDDISDESDTPNKPSGMQMGGMSPGATPLPDSFAADIEDVYRSLCRISWVLHSDQTEKIFKDAARLATSQLECVATDTFPLQSISSDVTHCYAPPPPLLSGHRPGTSQQRWKPRWRLPVAFLAVKMFSQRPVVIDIALNMWSFNAPAVLTTVPFAL